MADPRKDPMHKQAQYIILKLSGTLLRPDYFTSVLYPHARQQMYLFLRRNWCHPTVAAARERFARDQGAESFEEWMGGPGLPPEYAYERFREVILRQLIEQLYGEPLPMLLGLLWEEQLKAGLIEGIVVPESNVLLHSWSKSGRKIAFFSPSHAALERLITQYNEHENLARMCDCHIGSELGSAVDPVTYRQIAEKLQIKPQQMLYIANDAHSLVHAHESGCMTAWLAADASTNSPLPLHRINSLQEIVFA